MEIELFVEDPLLHKRTPLSREFPLFDYREFPSRSRTSRYDLIIYHMGNDIVHRFVYITLLEYPGLVVLHEPMLHHLMLQMLQEGWNDSNYARELNYNYGVVRDDIQRLVGADATELSRFQYPMIQRVIDSALGIIVHSEYARLEVLKSNPNRPVRKINFPNVLSQDAAELSLEEARRRIGIDTDAFLIGTFGFVTPAKRIESILDTLMELRREVPEARLAVVGGTVPEYPLDDLVQSRGLSEIVISPGYVSWQDFMLYMRACDVAVALRWPSAGETPAALIRLMGQGVPTVVSDYKAFREFPEEVCLKVNPAREREELLYHLRRAYNDREMLASLGERARVYVEERHRVEDTARQYAEFAHSVLMGGFTKEVTGKVPQSVEAAFRENLLEEVVATLEEMGVDPNSVELLRVISCALDGVLLPSGSSESSKTGGFRSCWGKET